MTFEAQVTGGELVLSDESTDYTYISIDFLGEYDVKDHYLEAIQDTVPTLLDAAMRLPSL